MGRDKALLDVGGRPLAALVVQGLAPLFEETFLVGEPRPGLDALGVRTVADLRPGGGPLSGLHTALSTARRETVFLCGCDMPFPQPALVRALFRLARPDAAAVPRSSRGLEPLFAFYGRQCLDPVEELIDAGTLPLQGLFPLLPLRLLPPEEVRRFDPEERSFRNVNSPEDFSALLRELGHEAPGRDAARGKEVSPPFDLL